MTASTDTTPAVDQNHPDGKGPESQPTEVAKVTKRTKYQDLGIQDLKQPEWAKDPGKPYLSPNGRFGTGLDARLKSNLITQVLEGKTDGPASTVAAAERLLQDLGWIGHLEASRTARQGKAERKAANAATKEAAKAAKAADPNDKVAVAKAAKAKAQEWVDKVVQVKQGRRSVPGQVLRVERTDDSDIASPYQAIVQVREDPANADSPTSEVTIPVAELKEAS